MKRLFVSFAKNAVSVSDTHGVVLCGRLPLLSLIVGLLCLLALATPLHAATCWPAWSSSTAYVGGSQVSYSGVNYQSAYWTLGNNPSTSSGPAGSGQPWIPEGSCSGSGGATPTPTASGCTPTSITPYIQVGSGSWQQVSSVTVSAGSSVTFGPQPASGGSWSWSGPNGYSSTSRQITVTISSSTTYTATYTNASGCKSTQAFTVTVTGSPTPTPTAQGCTPTAITPYIQVNGGSWTQTASATVPAGASVNLGPQPATGGISWAWTGPNGYTSSTRQITVTVNSTSVYTATYTNSAGCKSTQAFTLTVNNVPPPTPTPTAVGCTPTTITPYIQVNGGSWQQTSSATVSAGSSVNLGPQPATGGSWSWTGPNGYSSTSRQIGITVNSASVYTATYTNSAGCQSTQAFTITVSGSNPTPTPTSQPGTTTGTVRFHLMLGLSSTSMESLTLDGGNYNDLIMSNMIAGVMYGHLVEEGFPGIQYNKDYLYGSVMAQLLQENLATEYYQSSSNLIDPSSAQQPVMGVGQGGPYQINNYSVDMVSGSAAPAGHSLINYIALQKNIGYTMSEAAGQQNQPTPPSFNNKYYGPMLPAYFHYNDMVALNLIGKGPNGWQTPWEPAYDNALANFVNLPNSFLEVILNVAYNQGYYGGLVAQYSQEGATANESTVASVNSYSSVWGNSSSYVQYPYQVHYYLDQMYDNPIPTTSATTTVTPANHIAFGMSTLEGVFSNVFQTLSYSNGTNAAQYFTASQAQSAFSSALSQQGVSSSSTLDLSNASDRAKIFAVIDSAIGNLESAVGMKFDATTTSQL